MQYVALMSCIAVVSWRRSAWSYAGVDRQMEEDAVGGVVPRNR